MLVQRVTLADAFDAAAKFVPAGHIGTFDDDKIDPKKDLHLVDPKELPETAMVQIAAIAPTGPNPTMPQQKPADAVQGPGGGYFTPGKQLVAEVTHPQEIRIDRARLNDPDLENEVTEALRAVAEKRGVPFTDIRGAVSLGVDNTADAVARKASGEGEGAEGDAKLVDGTVKEITADLGGKTDGQLGAMLAAENAREKPRAGVVSAIEQEQASRKAQ